MANGTKPPNKTESLRTRGTGFPTLSLLEAMNIVETAGKYGRKHSAAGLAEHMGLTTDNSGSFSQKVAALKEWGFISGARETGFNLTDGAMIIAHPTSAEDTLRALIAAFQRSTVFHQTYDTLAKGADLQVDVIGNLAVNNLGVAIASKGRFARSFVDSVTVIGLAERLDKNTIRLKPMGADSPPELPTQRTITEDDLPSEVDSVRPISDSTNPSTLRPVLDQEWPTTIGKIRLQIVQSIPLPAKLYSQVGKVAQEIEQLAAMLDDDGAQDGSVSN
jgi:hypothetical protein